MQPRRYHTAPSRLRKRDVPAVWDLFALDDRANQNADDDDASSVASLSHAPSVASFQSEDTQQSDGYPPNVDRGGSWPRVRKQRTNEMGNAMSLFEVAEALGADELTADADLASLAQLVAEEEEELCAERVTEDSNVSIESFVDAVFRGVKPPPGNASAAHPITGTIGSGTAVGAPAPPSAAHSQIQSAMQSVQPKPQQRKHTANELALLEALKQDEAANAAAEAHGMGMRANAASPTFAALAGALDLARDAHDAPAPADPDADDVFAMLNMDLPAMNGSLAFASTPGNFDVVPPHPSPTSHSMSAHSSALPFSDEAFSGPLDATDYAAELPPLRACHPPHHAAANPYYEQPSHSRYDPHAYDPHRMDAHGMDVHGLAYDAHLEPSEMSTEQLAGRLEHTLGVSLESLTSSAQASRAPTVRAAGRGQRRNPSQSQSRPTANFSHPPHLQHPQYPQHPPHPPPSAHPPLPQHAQHAYSARQPHPPLHYSPESAPPTTRLNPENLAHIPSAPIQPIGHHPGMLDVHPQHGHYPPTAAMHAAPGAAAPAAAVHGAAQRNGAERKEWSVTEDNIIRESVMTHGCKWRRIAAQLPGRSDDAVRNRWNRLKEMGISETATPDVASSDAAAVPVASGGTALPLPSGMSASTGAAEGGAAKAANKSGAAAGPGGVKSEKPERVSWSKAEDDTILRGVAELGHKWNRIAERLPGRTDHAIRNRFHRLQTLLEDRQRQQQRVLAPNVPLPLPMPVGPIPMALPMPMPTSGPGGSSNAVHSLLTAGVEGMTPPPSGGESSGYETPVGSNTSPTANAKFLVST